MVYGIGESFGTFQYIKMHKEYINHIRIIPDNMVFPDGRIERSENVKDVASYIERIDEMIERKRRLFEE